MMLNELVTKATQNMQFVSGDLRTATKMAHEINRPEGPNLRDRALAAYLAECLDLARKLENKLLLLADLGD